MEKSPPHPAPAVRERWRNKNVYYHGEVRRLLKFLIPEGSCLLEIGSGTGKLLGDLKPSRGVGIDNDPAMIDWAREHYPRFQFLKQDAETMELDETFDFVLLSGCVGVFRDVWKVFRNIRKATGFDSRVIIVYYNGLWEPLLKIAQKLGWMMPRRYRNWLGLGDIGNLLHLNGFEIIKQGKKLLLPAEVPLLSWLANRILASLPFLWRFCLIEYVVAKKIPLPESSLRCSVIIPCRNEAGNIEPLLERLPIAGIRPELIFVDGYSTDGTVEKILELTPRYENKFEIKLIHQIPRTGPGGSQDPSALDPKKMLKRGKADALRKGFEAATGDVLIILDSDCTVPPEDIPKFFLAVAEARGDMINGTRLVYPLEKQAMRLFNLYANEMFGWIFSWLLNQRLKDTLCGTKAFSKQSYLKIRETRNYFGEFDPFGDFELLFGAAKRNLKIVELPVRYQARTYGDIKIERFKHGLLLVRMCWTAFLRFKLSL